jgi:hypothetical protein
MACRYRMAVGLLTPRSGRYGKERRAGRQEGSRAGRYGGGFGRDGQDGPVKEVLAVGSSPPAQAGTARRGSVLAEGLQGRSVRGEGWLISGLAGTGGLERSRPASETSYPGQYGKESRTARPGTG